MILDRIEAIARRHPHRLAVASEAGRATFCELVGAAHRVAERLTRGEPVLCLLPGGPSFTAAQLGAFAAGAPFFPLSPSSKPQELRQAVELGRPRTVLLSTPASGPSDGDWPAEAPSIPAIRFDGLSMSDTPSGASDSPHLASRPFGRAAIIQPTSGSTGAPKGVLLTEAQVLAGALASADLAESYAGAAVFVPIPQFHAMGGAVVLEHLLGGSSVSLRSRFTPGDHLRCLESEGVRLIAASPSYMRLLDRIGMLERLDGVTGIQLGSAATDTALIERIQSSMPHARIHLRYGLSECFGVLTRLDLEPGAPPPAPGLVGPARPGVELAALPAVGDGPAEELWVRSPAVAHRSIVPGQGLVPLVDDDDWLATGDAGYLGPDGVHIRGRLSQFIKRHGHRVDPSEVELALLAHPDVVEAAVVSAPDPLAESEIVAVVEGTISVKALLHHCRARLCDHKVPQKFVVLDHMPRTPAGKVKRDELRRLVAAGGTFR